MPHLFVELNINLARIMLPWPISFIKDLHLQDRILVLQLQVQVDQHPVNVNHLYLFQEKPDQLQREANKVQKRLNEEHQVWYMYISIHIKNNKCLEDLHLFLLIL